MITARKRKPDAVTVPHKEKKAKSNKKIIESDSDEDSDDNLDRDPLNI
jgi:hypothetical protein